MEITEEMINKYKISEWTEKSMVLTDIEIASIFKDLEQEKESPLVVIARLPFPLFAEIYFRRLNLPSKFTSNPSFGYALYFLTNSEIKAITKYARKEKINRDIINKFLEYLALPIEKIPFSKKSSVGATRLRQKFIHLTQYIDLEVAKKLNINLVPLFINSNENGYEVERKLELLNPEMRRLVENYYGFNGQEVHDASKLSPKIGLAKHKIKKIIDFLEMSFFRSYGDFKNKLEPTGKIDNMILYANRDYRTLDIELAVPHQIQQLSEIERKALFKDTDTTNFNFYKNHEAAIYIVCKYLFPSMSAIEKANYLLKDYDRIEEPKSYY